MIKAIQPGPLGLDECLAVRTTITLAQRVAVRVALITR